MTFTPVISTRSQQLASEVEPLHQRASRLAREREERLQQARAAHHSQGVVLTRKPVSAAGARKRVDTFMSWEEQRKAKLAELKKTRESEEMSACVFKPRTNTPFNPVASKFEERMREDQRKREERIQSLAVSAKAREVQECTHKPLTNLSKKVEAEKTGWATKVLKIPPIRQPLSLDEIFSLAREN